MVDKMSRSIGMYDYNATFYTGNKSQPDAMTIFVKFESGKKSVCRTNFPFANCTGAVPIVSTFTGVARIINATKAIFRELSQMKFAKNDPHLSECWNAFKNLFRGLIEIIPIVGNISLIVFDSIRGAVYFGKALKSLEGSSDIAGIALDGKVIFQVDLETVKEILEDVVSDQECLDLLDDYCSIVLMQAKEKAKKEGKTIDLPDILKKFPELL